MLRGETSAGRRLLGINLVAALGALAALLVLLGNPGNMGLCGACFARDVAGALRLHAGPAVFRPEVPGLVLGALAWCLASGRHVGRSGSNAVARFVLGVAMAFGALVFLGCPFRLLQRLGGGDLAAWLALPGFLVGVGLGRWFERRGYSIGKTHEVPLAVGLLGPIVVVVALVCFVAGSSATGNVLAGPGPGDAGPPAHAPWLVALGIGSIAGALLSATGFCGVNAARQVFGGPRPMLVAAALLVLAYALVLTIGGRFAPGLTEQPIAHQEWLWNTLALALVGLTGALCGGCPVRLIVLTGEGNGDAFVAVMGLGVGGALAHSLGIAAAPATAAAAGGPAFAGKLVVVVALVLVTAYAAALTLRRETKQA
jgi:uncharacterized protein